MLIEFLQNIGFKEEEAKVYLAGLELGNKPASVIAKRAGLERTHAYNILNRLTKRGLATKREMASVTHFQVVEPDMLANYLGKQMETLAQKEKKLQELLPQFHSHQNPSAEKSKVSFYEGLEGIKELYKDTYTTKDDTIYGFGDATTMKATLGDYVDFQATDRLKHGLKANFILADTRDNIKEDKKFLRELRFTPKKYGCFPTEITIYNDKVSFIVFGQEKSGVIIQNQAISDSIRMLWKIIWDKAKKH